MSPRPLVERDDYRARFDLRTLVDVPGAPEDASGVGDGNVTLAARTARVTFPRPSLSSAFVAPSDDVETRVAGIWADVLGLEEVGVEDDFSRLRTSFGLSLPIRTLFETPRVDLLAERIRALSVVAEDDDETVEDGEVFTL